MTNALRIAVLPGDGIGLEVTPAAQAVVDAALAATGAPALDRTPLHVGAQAYLDTGTDFSDEAKRVCTEVDAIYLGAMGLPAVRKADGTEIVPQIDLRFLLDLHAGVRPTRAIPGVPTPLADPRASGIDFAMVRESTEGLFASLGKGYVEDDARAFDTQMITRAVTEKVSHFSFDLAERRAVRRADAKRTPRVTLIDKANVFVSFAFMRKVFDEVAAARATTGPVEIATERMYVDASTLSFLQTPWDFDVILTENMFGDILSDLAAGLIGGMGYAPSADIGEANAVFQPAHGTAPDIMGTGKANPTAAILSGALMLDWLGTRHALPAMIDAGRLIERAVDVAFAGGSLRTCELGGQSGVRDVTDGVMAAIKSGA